MKKILFALLLTNSVFASEVGCFEECEGEIKCTNDIAGHERICACAEGKPVQENFKYTLSELTVMVGKSFCGDPVSSKTSKNVICKSMLGPGYKYLKSSAVVRNNAIMPNFQYGDQEIS